MSVTISNDNIITLSRGDTVNLPLFINEGSDLLPILYELKDNDKLYLGVMEPNQPFERAIVKKIFTNQSKKDQNNLILIKLEHEDTRELIPGKYFYQIKLRKQNEDETYDIHTIVDKTLLLIIE